jgi:hypothetical protein
MSLPKDTCLADLVQKLIDKLNEALLPAHETGSEAFSPNVALDKAEHSASRPGRFTVDERPCHTH